MNIYLDIDGVILTRNQLPANHVKEFLMHLTAHYPVFWLTTHCKGDAESTVDYLSRYFTPEAIALLRKIKPTDWNTSKTEAIAFNLPFLWFDDYIFDFERKDLIRHRALDSWIRINLTEDPDQLLDVICHFPK